MLNNQYNGNFILQKSSSEEPPAHGESDDQHQLKPVARSRTVSILCILLVWSVYMYVFTKIICIRDIFGSDFNLAVWQFWLWSPSLMYTNTNYTYVYFGAMYTEYHPVHQTKMSANVHHIPIHQIIIYQIYHVYGMYNVHYSCYILWNTCHINH